MSEKDWTAVKAWIAKTIADLCEMIGDDGTIVEIATAASSMLNERRKHRNED